MLAGFTTKETTSTSYHFQEVKFTVLCFKQFIQLVKMICSVARVTNTNEFGFAMAVANKESGLIMPTAKCVWSVTSLHLQKFFDSNFTLKVQFSLSYQQGNMYR